MRHELERLQAGIVEQQNQRRADQNVADPDQSDQHGALVVVQAARLILPHGLHQGTRES